MHECSVSVEFQQILIIYIVRIKVSEEMKQSIIFFFVLHIKLRHRNTLELVMNVCFIGGNWKWHFRDTLFNAFPINID